MAAVGWCRVAGLARAGGANLGRTARPPMEGGTVTAAWFFVEGIAMAGLPPLSGFIGKLLILDAGFASGSAVWIWAIVLGSSLISVVGFARAGSILFWKAKSVTPDEDADPAMAPSFLSYAAVRGLLALPFAHPLFAGPATAYPVVVSAPVFAPDA